MYNRASSTSTGMASLLNPTEEHFALRSALRKFVEKEVEPQANDFNRREAFNVDLFRKFGTNELGILGLTVSEKYNGTDFDATAVALVHEELSYSDPALCLSYLAHSLLFTNNLAVNGNEDQKQCYLPGACDGSLIGGMCMSEAAAGTDVLGMKTSAKYDDSMKGWVLNGTKIWITNGTLDGKGTGDIFLVYAKTGDQRTDVTQFLVRNDMDGFSLGQKIKDKLGMRASPTAELVFKDVFIPEDHVVGEVNGALLCMMRNLEIERVGLAAMGLGIARRCIDVMKEYANERSAFGSNLYKFGQIQRSIAESYAEFQAGRSYVYSFANSLDLQTHGNGLDADGVKLYCARMSKNVADRAIQVLGGYGYVGEYVVERLWRDAKLLEIGGGTNESHHKNIARDLSKMGSTPLN
eukprot:CAMPEP_0194214322 /NCGR_PEP_ID=MMETSP0156-20130528/15488_1 /TAXON_ID=33649 /ORGANISM="Thalassionema nitzschioides, Strain L26-B" /LENGTH=408 /DNA_ID=CAMNT_0038942553 /DNA_START=208 /DNA_END=1434 /DNA_ORIENTATION=-